MHRPAAVPHIEIWKIGHIYRGSNHTKGVGDKANEGAYRVIESQALSSTQRKGKRRRNFRAPDIPGGDMASTGVSKHAVHAERVVTLVKQSL